MNSTNVVIPAYFPKSQVKENSPSVAIIDVTPEIADYWLKTHNTENRPVSQANIDFLAEQMTRGQWRFNGDTLSFLPDGTLNDSQHRLHAVVKSGITIKAIVVIGVDSDAFKTKDTGKKRSGSDVLAIEGYKYYAMMSAASTFLIAWEAGKISGATSGKKLGVKTSNTDISAYAELHREKLQKYCQLASEFAKTGDKLIKSSWLCAFLFLLSKKNATKAQDFVFRLATGSNIKHATCMYQLRKKLMDAARSDSKKIPAFTKLGLIIKTWNFEQLGKHKKRLTFNPSNGERFPKII